MNDLVKQIEDLNLRVNQLEQRLFSMGNRFAHQDSCKHPGGSTRNGGITYDCDFCGKVNIGYNKDEAI